ncbi:MAG: isoprenylcysteine carboxylmethyltransferase family protein [Nanoarchaeota archaeon]|nr:isoprenylcysteine carboxylmethyltransferase family protein [Nanoarchaeota archaeon]
MSIEIILLKIIQATGIITFLVFLFFVFFPKIKTDKTHLKKYFTREMAIKESIILTSFYIFLFYILFFTNNISPMPIYIVGFVVSITGLIVAMIGRLQLRNLWNPITNIYKSKEILEVGIFSKIRHPIYLGRLFFFAGTMLMLNLRAIFLAPFYWDYLRNRLIQEEEYLQKVNPRYKKYMKKAKRIIF